MWCGACGAICRLDIANCWLYISDMRKIAAIYSIFKKLLTTSSFPLCSYCPSRFAGEAAADALRKMNFTGSGHLEHMPAHTFMRTGRYNDVIISNMNAYKADDLYLNYHHLPYGPAHNSYTLVVGAMLDGQVSRAIEYGNIMRDIFIRDTTPDYPGWEMGWNVVLQVYVRFGMWKEILADTLWDSYNPIETENNYSFLLARYCRVIASLKLGDYTTAAKDYDAFNQIIASGEVDAGFSERVIVAMATLTSVFALTNDSIEYALVWQKNANDEYITWGYNNPPKWSHPTRECFGTLLLKNGNYSEAIVEFQNDLKEYPENGFALYGLFNAMVKAGNYTKEEVDVVEGRFDVAWERGDAKLESPCYIFE